MHHHLWGRKVKVGWCWRRNWDNWGKGRKAIKGDVCMWLWEMWGGWRYGWSYKRREGGVWYVDNWGLIPSGSEAWQSPQSLWDWLWLLKVPPLLPLTQFLFHVEKFLYDHCRTKKKLLYLLKCQVKLYLFYLEFFILASGGGMGSS